MPTTEEFNAYLDKVREESEKIKSTDLDEVMKELKKIDVVLPTSYEDVGVEAAISTLGSIQKYRDIVISLKIKVDRKADSLNRVWLSVKNFILINDPKVSDFSTQQMKESYCQNLMTNLYDKVLQMNSVVTAFEEIKDNAIAKWNICSRQIAVLEMQVSLGEVERKKTRAWKTEKAQENTEDT